MIFEELIILLVIMALFFFLGFLKGSEVTQDEIRRKFWLKKDYSYNDFMNVIDDN